MTIRAHLALAGMALCSIAVVWFLLACAGKKQAPAAVTPTGCDEGEDCRAKDRADFDEAQRAPAPAAPAKPATSPSGNGNPSATTCTNDNDCSADKFCDNGICVFIR